MKIVVITESNLPFDSTDILLINPTDFVNTAPVHWANYEMEYIPFLITEHLKTILNKDSIVYIDYDLNFPNKFLLAHHIITSIDVGLSYFSFSEANFSRFEEDYGLLRSPFIQIVNIETLQYIVNDLNEVQRVLTVYNNLFDYETYKDHYQSNSEIDRHQATNEWGALKLLFNHGLSFINIETLFAFPQTILFKQKLKEFNINGLVTINTSGYAHESSLQRAMANFAVKSNQISSILLIDDNANKGWSVVIKTLFPNSNLDIKLEYDDAVAIVDFGVYDFIFLDLRLPTNHTDRSPRIENGISLIDKIKNANSSLHVPLIVFTASQKAETLHIIQQKGADAMYIKQPTYFSYEQSMDNYLNLISELNNQIDKGIHLRYYWKLVVQTKNNLLPEIIDLPNKILKSRIIERLEMFYGLIKKSHEQYSFNDSKFHFSSDILSFMTLWSTLNEIQECHFKKGGEFSHIKLEDLPRYPGRFLPIELDNWAIKNQLPQTYFILEKPIFEENISNSGIRNPPNKNHIRRELYSKIQYNKASPPYYSIAPIYTQQRNINKTLSFQIAHILLEKNSLKISTKKNMCLKILKQSNDLRNNLYLTHGESISSTFHTNKEQHKHLPVDTTKNLFNLIVFLLTGLDSHI